MGGNVKFDGGSASKISFKNRKYIFEDLIELLNLINTQFSIRFKHIPWSYITQYSVDTCYFSGSSKLLFDDSIEDNYFKKYKPYFGDIDIQVDKNQLRNFLSLFEYYKQLEFETRSLKLIDYKKSNEQIITLWKHTTGNIQIDFEFVDFEQGKPSDWAQFSRNSSIEDTKLGIKGVFHKLLIRALTGKHLTMLSYYDTNNKIKTEICSFYAFSVSKGLRYKFTSIEKNNKIYHKKIKPVESDYIIDIRKIFSLLFENIPVYSWTLSELNRVYSFNGLVEQINKYCTNKEKENIITAFKYSLFSNDAQKISRDLNEDERLKNIALTYLTQHLKFT